MNKFLLLVLTTGGIHYNKLMKKVICFLVLGSILAVPSLVLGRHQGCDHSPYTQDFCTGGESSGGDSGGGTAEEHCKNQGGTWEGDGKCNFEGESDSGNGDGDNGGSGGAGGGGGGGQPGGGGRGPGSGDGSSGPGSGNGGGGQPGGGSARRRVRALFNNIMGERSGVENGVSSGYPCPRGRGLIVQYPLFFRQGFWLPPEFQREDISDISKVQGAGIRAGEMIGARGAASGLFGIIFGRGNRGGGGNFKAACRPGTRPDPDCDFRRARTCGCVPA